MEINEHEFHRRIRYSNLLSLAEDSLVEVFIYGGIHIEGRILEHSVTDEQASLLVDCEGFVMMLDVGNITHIEYAPDTDRFILQVTERVSERFQPAITPTEVAEYLAETLLDEAEQAAEDEHEEMPEWLANMDLCNDDEDESDPYSPSGTCPVLDGDDFGAHHYEDDEEGGEDTE